MVSSQNQALVPVFCRKVLVPQAEKPAGILTPLQGILMAWPDDFMVDFGLAFVLVCPLPPGDFLVNSTLIVLHRDLGALFRAIFEN